jgi:hypothetical protein
LGAEGWGKSKDGFAWSRRVEYWYRNGDVPGYDAHRGIWDANPYGNRNQLIPIFPNYAKRALRKVSEAKHLEAVLPQDTTSVIKGDCIIASTIQPTTKREQPMKNTMNTLIDKNKAAAEITAKIGVGKTANKFFLSKLLGKFPWYVKLFSRKKEAENNPVAKFATAQTAMALVTHFAPDNQKLNYVAESMVTEAMVDLTINSEIVEKMLGELESLVSLPKELG